MCAPKPRFSRAYLVSALERFRQNGLGLGTEGVQFLLPAGLQFALLLLYPAYRAVVAVLGLGGLAAASVTHREEEQVEGSRLAFGLAQALLQCLHGLRVLAQPVVDHAEGVPV